MMFKRIALAIVVFALALVPASAQDNNGDQTMGDQVVCDSTVITLLFIAEYQYGFHSMMDVSVFDKGQFGPWFDAMMSAMEDGSMGDGGMMPESTPDSMMGDSGGDMMDMTHLEPGVVGDEDPACAQLRTELESFFTDTFNHEFMIEDSSM